MSDVVDVFVGDDIVVQMKAPGAFSRDDANKRLEDLGVTLDAMKVDPKMVPGD